MHKHTSLLFFVLIIAISVIVVSYERIESFFNGSKAFDTPARSLVVDHNSVALFDQIPPQYLEAARNLRMVFVNRSVGSNVNEGLTCLTYDINSTSSRPPNRCRRNVHADPSYSSAISEVTWTGSYPRPNWTYLFWAEEPSTPAIDPNINCPYASSEWYDKVRCFSHFVGQNINNYDVFGFDFSYLEVDGAGDQGIDNPTTGFFANRTTQYDVGDIEQLETANPSKHFIYWTTSLARSIGTRTSENFNNAMRTYANANYKILFDLADIESHDPSGNPCYDNRDGVYYSNGNLSENHADDGVRIPAICPHYTTEIDGGHLGNVSVGQIRAAKAYWVLMAQIAGWRPNGGTVPTSSATPTPSASATPTPTATVVPTATPTPTASATPLPSLPPSTTPAVHLNFDSLSNYGCSGCTASNVGLGLGVVSNAFSFNGSSSKVQFSSMPYIKGSSAFSLTMWVNPNFNQSSSTRYYPFSDGNALTVFNLSTVSGWRTRLRTSNGSYTLDSTPALAWNAGTWHMIGVTYNGSQLIFYWDGVEKGRTNATGTVFSDAIQARVGASLVNANNFNGLIDQFKVYNVALSASDIQSRFNGFE